MYSSGDLIEVMVLRDVPYYLVVYLPSGQSDYFSVRLLDSGIDKRPDRGDRLVLLVSSVHPERKRTFYVLEGRKNKIQQYWNGNKYLLPPELTFEHVREKIPDSLVDCTCEWKIGSVLMVKLKSFSGVVSTVEMPNGESNWLSPDKVPSPKPNNGEKMEVVVLGKRRDGRCMLSGLPEDIQKYGIHGLLPGIWEWSKGLVA